MVGITTFELGYCYQLLGYLNCRHYNPKFWVVLTIFFCSVDTQSSSWYSNYSN
jgi:hypothetical protein